MTAPCGAPPLLTAPSLAGGDGIDSATVSFLVQVTLVQNEEEKEETAKRSHPSFLWSHLDAAHNWSVWLRRV